MDLRRPAALAAVLLSIAGGAPANALYGGPPAITVFPDDRAVDVSFFFPAGGPLERFTGRPGAWYAVYRSPMHPGRPYVLLLEHQGDPERMKVFALDGHPFDKVSVKSEIPLRKIDDGGGFPDFTYASAIVLPRDASVRGIHLLLEWMPPPGEDRPLPVSIRLLSRDPRRPTGQGSAWRFPWTDQRVKSPLEGRSDIPHEIPVPRWDSRDRGPEEWIGKERGK